MQPIYRYFAGDHENLDFSEQSALEAYLWETRGEGNFKVGLFEGKPNGYVVGKHWMDATVKMWLEDLNSIPKLLHPYELLCDPELVEFRWWIEKVINRKLKR
jgi:hypothetical protein